MVSSAASAPSLTVDEWAALDEDAAGELVDGRLEEEEMPTALHEAVAAWLLWAMRSWVGPHGGMAFGAELKLVIEGRRGRKADASMYLPGRPLPGKHAGATRRAPSIVVEIMSPRPRDVRRDTVDKKRDYAALGVSFYWLVDPNARTFEVLELGADGRFSIALTAADGAHPVPGCPGFVIDLDAMWASADALPDDDEVDPREGE
jgi:Uma2 family endonuclease